MMTDLFTTAMAWVSDQGLPEPDSMKLVHDHRIELTYLDTPHDRLPDLGWTPTSTTTHVKSEHQCGDIVVSVFARQAVAA